MRIAINTRLVIANKMDGIGWFTAETVKNIIAKHPEHHFYLFFDRKPDAEFVEKSVTQGANNATIVALTPPARHPVLWYMYFEWSVPRALKRLHIEAYLTTDGFASLHTDVPTLTVMHDLNFEHAKGNLKWSHQLFMHHYFPLYARHSARIATVSEYSKRDIAATYGIAPDKIGVVYNGAHSDYKPLSETEQATTRMLYTDGKPYFIFISTILKRKNLTGLLKAFDEFKAGDTCGTRLVVVGQRAWWKDDLAATYASMKYQDDVILFGRAEPQVLAKLLSSAIALVYPSFFEGFGIPIVEAFSAGTAVITSNTTSMPEIAGDAALLIDPYNHHTITEAMKAVAYNGTTRTHLIDNGVRQLENFSWQHTADLVWGEIETMMNRTIKT